MKINLTIVTLFLLVSFAQVTKAQTNQNSDVKQTDDVVYKPSEVDQKFEVISKPPASTNGNCGQFNGLASVRVVFHKSGKVTKANLKQSSGCVQFDENALKAARRIKFKPALKNNQAVSVATIVEYQYQVY